MPSLPKVAVLNLGMQNVGGAVFQRTPNGGLCLLGWKTVELIVDSTADATRPAQIEQAMGEIGGLLELKGKEPTAVVLPSQSVFTRFVRLPGATAQDVEQIIGFEAQQNVPFPIDEVVWDYQIMGGATNGSWDIVLVAIKSDQLSELVGAVQNGGQKPTIIDTAPVALYNAFRFNYPNLSGCSLLVDIGARTTNLIFIEGQRLFSRSIPVGGNSISAAIAKEFKQDIAVAERFKVERGFVGLGGAYAEPDDPVVARISKLVRNTMTRLHAEIARSINFYKQSQGGSPPVRTFLAGGTVSMRYMLEFFNEKLQIPVEYFNPLRNVTVSDAALAQRVATQAHVMGELVGGALRLAGPCPIEINLRPKSLVRELDLARRKPSLILAAACVLAALASWYAFGWRASHIAEQKLAEVNSLVAGLEDVAQKLDAVEQEIRTLEKQAAPLVEAARERTFWTGILDELNRRLPPRFIWITRLTPLSGERPIVPPGASAPVAAAQSAPSGPPRPGEQDKGPSMIDALEITGLYLANPPNENEARVIDQFVENLQRSPLFKIESPARVVVERKTPDGLSWAYPYRLRIPLAEPIMAP